MISIAGKTDGYDFPESFITRYRSADSAALKVAVYVLMNGSADEATLHEELGISASAAQRSVEFWKNAGLIIESDGNHSETNAKVSAPIKQSRRHMTQSEIAVALLGNEEYAVLLQESQRLLGRELSISESRLLVETVTENDIPVPCLLMLESYWQNTEKVKNVLSKTASTAKEWAEEGIRTHDEAETALSRMEDSYRHALSVSSIMNMDVSAFTKKERRIINTIFEEYGYDESFISEVLIRNPEANIPYIAAVLKDWNKKGYRTISDTRLLGLSQSASQTAKPTDTKSGDSLFRKAIKRINEEK